MGDHFNNVLLDRVQKAGLLPAFRRGRSIVKREASRWIAAGCPSPAPAVIKMSIVGSYVREYRAKIFVETGTLIGGMVEHIALDRSVECHTIEIDKAYYNRAKRILGRKKNINFHLGDSAEVLPRILAELDRPSVFWLDGHYSGGVTGKASYDTPVSREVELILAHRINNHVILIDDAREFTGEGDYPPLADLLSVFTSHTDYRAEVSADIVRIVPRRP